MRVLAVRLLRRVLSREQKLVGGVVRELLRVARESTSSGRYFENSVAHRKKLRVAQALALICDLVVHDQVMIIKVNWWLDDF
jgi:hypothetical protein